MKNLIYLLLVTLTISCSSFRVSTLNYDPIYGPDGTEIKVDTIESEWELNRKFRFDDRFRWDFAQYAMTQNLRWHTDFYWNNRMHRSPFVSSFDFYWNSNQYWWNWASNYPFNYGYNHWDRFGFYGNYGYNSWNNWGSYGYGWNHWGWRQQMNTYAWQHRNRPNTAYINGRRGSNINNNNIGRRVVDIVNNNNNSVSSVIRINKPRPNTTTETVDNTLDWNINDITNTLIKNFNGNVIRVYTNPNNVPNVIIRNNNNSNNNSNNVRGSWKPNNNSSNNNVRVYQRPSNNGSSNIRNSSSNNTKSSSSSSNNTRSSVKSGNNNKRQ